MQKYLHIWIFFCNFAAEMETKPQIITGSMSVEQKLQALDSYLLSSFPVIRKGDRIILEQVVRDDVDVVQLLEQIERLRWIWLTKKRLTPEERELCIVDMVRIVPTIRRVDMARMMRCSYVTVKRHLSVMEAANRIEFVGPDVRFGHWHLK